VGFGDETKTISEGIRKGCQEVKGTAIIGVLEHPQRTPRSSGDATLRLLQYKT
jgi:hypothetical protein